MNTKKLLLFLLALTLFVLLLASCDLGGRWDPDATVTYASVTTDGAGNEPPLSDEEFAAFYSLVDQRKVSRAELYYRQFYVGEYRSVEDCAAEIEEAVRAVVGIRTVTDTETATGLYIDLYARMQGDYYAYYYSPDDYGDYGDDLEGEYTGIGVSVSVNEEGYAEILNVFPGSPAEEVGMLPGDVLIAVGGEDFARNGYNKAVDRTRGEAGTSVSLTVRRGASELDFTVVRRPVTEVTVDSRMIGEDVGYIRIISFNERTYEQFVAAHRALDAQGAASFVFDVRYNPGGTLNSVVAILEYILPDGPIVRMNYKNDGDDATVSSIYDIHTGYMNGDTRVYYENHAITEPMVVLTNGGTASAGELFTSALNDYDVATVVGETTYGKGVGQSSLPLANDGSYLVFTVFYYDPPFTGNYKGVGITPDVAVSLSEEAAGVNIYKLPYEQDAQLQYAVGHLAGTN